MITIIDIIANIFILGCGLFLLAVGSFVTLLTVFAFIDLLKKRLSD